MKEQMELAQELAKVQFSAVDMLSYLEEQMEGFERTKRIFGMEDRETIRRLDDMLACKEMVEALIGLPVNLRKDGKVTVGF